MATTTPNYGLRKPTNADIVNVATDISGNMDLLDAHAHSGTYVRVANSAYNVKEYGALGNGVADDSAAIQAAITAATAARGGAVYLPAGVYLCGTTITLPSNIHLWGDGIGGDIFSATKGTTIKLKNGTNADLIKTAGFDGFTGVTAPGTEPNRFGLHQLVLDGNKANNTAGKPLRIYGRNYVIDNLTIQNGAEGGCYSEWVGGGYEMEAMWSNFKIFDCGGGHGLEFKGPHDSQFVNGVVARGELPYYGIYLNGGGAAGSSFVNAHVWGTMQVAWQINAGCYLIACQGEGATAIQCKVDAQEVVMKGCHFFNGATSIGLQVGDAATGGYPARCFIDARISGVGTCVAFEREGGYNNFDLLCYPVAAGTTMTGSPAATSELHLLTDTSLNAEVAAPRTIRRGRMNLDVAHAEALLISNTAGRNVVTVDTTDAPNPTLKVQVPITATGSPDPAQFYDRFGVLQFAVTQSGILTGPVNGVAQIRSQSGRSTIRLRDQALGTNYVQVANAPDGTSPAIEPQGTATDVGLSLAPKGAGIVSATSAIATAKGATGSRPAAATVGAGAQWFDSTLNEPIWSDGTNWLNANGQPADAPIIDGGTP